MSASWSAQLDAGLARQALDLAPLMVRDLDGRVQIWSRGLQQLYGYTAAEASGQISHELLNTAFPQPLAEIEAELLEQGRWSGELVHRRRDNDLVVVASQWSLVRTEDGAPRAVTEVNTDISKAKRGEEDNKRLAGIVENSQDAIIGKSLDGIITSWNKAAEEMFGYAAREILGRPITLLFPSDRIAEEALILDRLRQGERIDHYETVRRRKDGRDIHVSLSVSPIRNLAGEIVGASKIARDITEQKLTQARLEEVRSELLHVSRLSTMGQMAATLAHELNQPLAAVRSYLSALRRLVGAPSMDAARIGDIVTRADGQVARAAEVIKQLREFVAKGEAERRFEDLNEVVEEAAALALVEARQRGVEVSMRLGRDLPPAFVNRVQIQQVVLNLVRNAIEAMEDTEPQLLTVSTAQRGDALEMTVADNGPGIAPEIASRLFQPFISSKRTGMGMGLSICRDIVEAHGGRLAAASNTPRGTVFSVTLPLQDMGEANGA